MEKNIEFFNMQHFPKEMPDDSRISVNVLVFSKDAPSFCEIGCYDFIKDEWMHYGAFSIELICWCYIPNPTEFLKDKKFKSVKHIGYTD